MSSDTSNPTLVWLRSHRFWIRLWALVANLLLAPLLATSPILHAPVLGGLLSAAAFGAVLIAAVLAVSHRRSTTTIAIGLAAVALVATVLNFVQGSRGSEILHHLLDGIFLLFVVGMLVRHIFGTSRVTLDLIKAALCAYLILGLMCASFFAAIEGVSPGSFHLPGEGQSFSTPGFDVDEDVTQVYFSFVTLLTLGYGDVYPVGSLARIVAVLEAFAGQVMMVVLVARLVGVHVAQTLEAPKSEGPADS